MLRAFVLAAPLALAAAPASAHPHVFIDGGVDFVFDGEGRLTDLRVIWIYDALTSLFMLEELGLDAVEDAALTATDRAQLAAYQTEWIEGFDGDSYLWRGDARVGLSGPEDATAALTDGRVVISFLRRLAEPFRPDADTVVKIYDPTYFTDYAVTQEPRLEGASGGCSARVEPFEPSGTLVALQRRLFSIGMDATPADPNVGALFADEVFVSCD